jgi:uncharacterized membrane protein
MSAGAIEPQPAPPLTRAGRAFGFLAAEGASVALAVFFVAARGRLPLYVYNNTLPAGWRKAMVAALLAGAIAGAGWGLVVWMRRRAAGLDVVEGVAHRLAPLCLAAFVPLLFHWQLWTGQREISFAALAAAFGLSLQGLMRVALAAPPLLPAGPGARLGAARADLAGWLARLPWLPFAIVAVAVLRYAIYFSIITIRNHYNLQTAGYDLGVENNLVWNAAHWNGPLFKTSVHADGPNGTHIGLHETYISYLIGIPYRLAPRPETLLVLQSILIGGAAFPLYAFARRHLGAWTACFVALLFLFNAPAQGSNLYDFHYLPFAPLFLWTTLALLEARRDRWAAVAIVLTLANREDMSALLVVIGVYLVLAGERPRAGAIVAAVGAAYFVVVKFMVMPHFIGFAAYIHQYKDLVPEGETGFGGVLKTVFGNPGYTTTTVLERQKMFYLLQIMAPLAFFPWRRPIGLLCTLPGFFFTIIGTRYPALTRLGFQYTAYWTTFLFLAVVANLRWLDRTRQVVSRRAWMVAMAAATLVTCYQFGPVFQTNTTWAGFLPLRVEITPDDRARHDALYALIDQIPADASVAASEMLVAQVSSRKNAYTLKHGSYDADYILVRLPPSVMDRDNLVAALRTGTYGLVAERGDFVLFRRGAPGATVEAFLHRIGA